MGDPFKPLRRGASGNCRAESRAGGEGRNGAAGLGWAEDALLARRKGHGAKVRLARRLRQETTMSLKWIAQRLHMSSWTYVSNLLNEPPKTHPEAQDVLLLCQ